MLEQTWTIQFLGNAEVAARQCRQAHGAMKLGKNRWLQIWACGPTGHWVQSHISPDKNALRRATEITTRKFTDILGQHLDVAQYGAIYGMKPEGGVFVNWVPLVKIVPQPSGAVQLQWSDSMVAHCKLYKQALTAELDAALSAADGGSGLRARLAQTRWSP